MNLFDGSVDVDNRHTEKLRAGPFEHLQRPVEPLDSFSVNCQRAALDFGRVDEIAVNLRGEVEWRHSGKVRAHDEHEAGNPVRIVESVLNLRSFILHVDCVHDFGEVILDTGWVVG